MNLIAFADIHADYNKLVKVIDKLDQHPKVNFKEDKFIFLGDVVDGGTGARPAIQFLIDFSKDHDCVFVLGNHEDLLLNAIGARQSVCYPHINEDDFYLWFSQGGRETVKSYTDVLDVDPLQKSLVTAKDAIWKNHIDWMKNMVLYYETDYFIFVHAGLRPGVQPKDSSPNDLLWIRDYFIDSNYDWGKRVIYGHTNQKDMKPLVMPNKIGIDTMHHGHGDLTAVILNEAHPKEYEFVTL